MNTTKTIIIRSSADMQSALAEPQAREKNRSRVNSLLLILGLVALAAGVFTAAHLSVSLLLLSAGGILCVLVFRAVRLIARNNRPEISLKLIALEFLLVTWACVAGIYIGATCSSQDHTQTAPQTNANLPPLTETEDSQGVKPNHEYDSRDNGLLNQLDYFEWRKQLMNNAPIVLL